MKKIIFILLTIAIFSFASCNIIDISNTKPDSTIEAPSIIKAETSNVISPTIVTGTTYMNFFRYEVDSNLETASEVEDSLMQIGQVSPVDGYSGSYQFEDLYSDSTKYYKYYVRYKTSSGGYRYSKESGIYAGKGTAGVKVITPASGTSVALVYDKTQYMLTLDTSLITMPSTIDPTVDFTLMAGLSNGTNTLLFPMEKDVANSRYSVSLRNVLVDYFFDKDLSIECVLGQTREETKNPANTDVIYKTFHWTSSLSATLTDGTEDIETFIVPSSADAADTPDYTSSL